MKQIAQHSVLSATQIFQSESLVGYPARKLSYLTPNVASEGRRSAQHGGVPSTGWLDFAFIFLKNLAGPNFLLIVAIPVHVA